MLILSNSNSNSNSNHSKIIVRKKMMRLKILLCLIISLWVSDVSYASENIPKETSESSPVTPIAAPALASGALSQMPDPKTFVKKQWPAPEHTLLSHVELIIMHAILSHCGYGH